jgi:hypothetical protein
MDLDGAWEIGLAEIQYPHSWYNVKNKEAWWKSQRIVRKVIHGTVTRQSQVKHASS